MPDIRRGYDLVAERYAAEIGGELAAKPIDRALLDALAELAAATAGPAAGPAAGPSAGPSAGPTVGPTAGSAAGPTAGAVVLDVGCGPGHITAHLAGRGVHAVGADLSPAMGAVARRVTSLPFCAADMTALPIRSRSVAGIACLYAVIHLDAPGRAAAYREFARVLRAGGSALVAFHTSDASVPMGQATTLTEWWGHEVRLTFRYLDPAAETDALARAGLDLVARLDREPDPAAEHPSRRSYLLVRRAG